MLSKTKILLLICTAVIVDTHKHRVIMFKRTRDERWGRRFLSCSLTLNWQFPTHQAKGIRTHMQIALLPALLYSWDTLYRTKY